MEQAGFPVVNITAVPSVSQMVGLSRVLRGESVANILGNAQLTRKEEKNLRRRYVLRALELLKTGGDSKQVFTLSGAE
jgi:glycine/betaine/sarcosine/D-proline reductase family selenoprotein B